MNLLRLLTAAAAATVSTQGYAQPVPSQPTSAAASDQAMPAQPAVPNQTPPAAGVLVQVAPVYMVQPVAVLQPPDPSIHRHDGFYLRLGLGLGYVSDSASENDGTTFKIHGTTIPIDIMIGGSLVPGLVLGGGIWIAPMVSPKVDFEGQTLTISSNYTVQFNQIGPFLDYYPNPHEGLHILGAVTYAGLTLVEDATNTTLANVKGFGLTAGLGYDFWIGNQWSMGVLGQFSYANLSADSESHQLISPALLGSATFN